MINDDISLQQFSNIKMKEMIYFKVLYQLQIEFSSKRWHSYESV